MLSPRRGLTFASLAYPLGNFIPVADDFVRREFDRREDGLRRAASADERQGAHIQTGSVLEA